MADQKISELTTLTGANVADDDAIAIVDTSATETKKIVFSELKNALDTATGFVRITGDTMTGALDVQSTITSDGLTTSGVVKAPDGSNSAPAYTNSGDADGGMYFPAANQVSFASGGRERLNIGSNGDISFYEDTGTTAKLTWDASAEMLTTSGLTVDGDANLSGAAVNFDLDETDTTDLNTRFRQSAGQLFIQTLNDAKSLGSNRVNINHTTGDISFYEDTGSTAKFFWDASAESLGIGTSSPTAVSGSVALEITGTSGSEVIIGSVDTTATAGDLFGAIAFKSIDSNGTPPHYSGIKATAADTFGGASLEFYAGRSNYESNDPRFVIEGPQSVSGEAMRIDSSGRLGIGRTPTSNLLEVADTIKLTNLGTSEGFIGFNTNGQKLSMTATDAVGAGMKFEVGASEAMRIDSSGNVLVSHTGSVYNNINTTSTIGSSLTVNGEIFACSDQSSGVMILNRKTAGDGDILGFRKNGSPVGSIGSVSGSVSYIVLDPRTNGSGIRGTTNGLLPTNQAGTATNDHVDLGSDTNAFRNLYLSGGVYLGGVGSANKLDDYEYGFFEPTYTGSTTNPSGVTYDPTVGNEGYYVKVGRAVFIQINIRTDAISNVGAGDLRISGLPFAAASVSGQGGFASFAVGQSTDFAGEAPSSGYVTEGSTNITLFYRLTSDGSSSSSQCTDLGTGTNDNLVRISGTYYSTA